MEQTFLCIVSLHPENLVHLEHPAWIYRINQISKIRFVSDENKGLILSRINTIKHDEQD